MRVERSSALAADAERVWAWVTTFAGVNDELRPWLRMTAPRRLRETTLDEVELGRRVCRSWVLLGGVLPVEYDDVTLVERGPVAARLSGTVVGAIFAHRHRRLARRFGRCRPRVNGGDKRESVPAGVFDLNPNN